MTPTFKGKGGRGQFEDNSYLTYCSYHAFTLMSTPRTYELGWLSYLSNILSPLVKKWGSKKDFCSLRSRSPTFKTMAPPLISVHTRNFLSIAWTRWEAQSSPADWGPRKVKGDGRRKGRGEGGIEEDRWKWREGGECIGRKGKERSTDLHLTSP